MLKWNENTISHIFSAYSEIGTFLVRKIKGKWRLKTPDNKERKVTSLQDAFDLAETYYAEWLRS